MALLERFRDHSVAEALTRQSEAQPDRPLLILGDRRITYSQIEAQAASLAAAMQQLGIEQGDRVALNLPNWPEFVVGMFAAAKLGAVIVPLNPRHTNTELQYMLRHSEAAAVITIENFEGVDFLARFEGLIAVLPDLQYVISVGDEDLWYDDRVYQFEDLLSSGEGREYSQPEIDAERDVFAIVYTSGTMGKPKGVCLTHANLLTTAAATADALDLSAQDVVGGVTALFNVFALGPGVLGTILAGATLVLEEEHDSEQVLAALVRENVTVYHGVPTSFVLDLHALEESGLKLHTLRTGVVAGAPVSEELISRVQEEMVPDIRIAYGLTETGSNVTITRSDDPPGKRRATVGRPLEGFEIRILDLDGSELPVESVGEVAVRGPGIMQGYYRQPGETAVSLTDDGFFLTGDLGMLDEEGYLHILGRRKEMIIRGGFNVYPREVEDRLHAHPGVLGVAVVGLPDEVLGEIICACVIPVEGAIITGDEIKEFCREVLADYKVPDLVRFLDEFPMSGSGKVRRVELARIISAEESSRRV